MLTEQQIANTLIGAIGVEAITDTAAHTGLFGVLLPLTDCVVSALKSEFLTPATGLDGKTLSAGIIVPLPRITSITLTSGTMLAYRMPPEGR